MASYTDMQQLPDPSESVCQFAAGDAKDNTTPHLTADGLVDTPELLQEEIERTENELQEVVAKNCDLLLASSRALGSIERDVKIAFSTVTSLKAATDAVQRSLQDFLAAEAERSKQVVSLQRTPAAQNDVARVLALPWTIRNYYEAGRYAEAVDALISAREQVLLLRARTPPGNESLRELQLQIEGERGRCRAAVLHALESPSTHFADIVKFVGYLRRLDIFPEQRLRRELIKRRSISIDCKKYTVEKQCATCPTKALCAAANLLATGILEVVVQYRALFKELDEVAAAWLSDQVIWFLALLHSVLNAGSVVQEALSQSAFADTDEATAAVEEQATPATAQAAPAAENKASASEGVGAKETAGPGEVKVRSRRLEPQNVCAVYRETHHAAANLGRVGGYFFVAAAPAFQAYLLRTVESLTSGAAQKFTEEMENASASWFPGSMFCGPSAAVDSAIASTVTAASAACEPADSAVFQKRLTLLWYPPLCLFYNGLVCAVNAVLDFPLVGILSFLFSSVFRALWRGALSLRSVSKARGSDASSSTDRQKEFTHLCRAFSNELLDLLGHHLRPLQEKPGDTQVYYGCGHPL